MDTFYKLFENHLKAKLVLVYKNEETTSDVGPIY